MFHLHKLIYHKNNYVIIKKNILNYFNYIKYEPPKLL